MDRILYCAGPFSTYSARTLYSQEPDKVMFRKNKDIIELCHKYKLRLDIKVHPSDERSNYAHFKYLSKNYKNVRVIGGYWKWFLKAERMIPHYQLVILDIIRTAVVPAMARTDIPTIIYTRKLESWNMEGLKKIFHIVKTKGQLETLIKKFSFGELYLPEDQELLNKWFEKRETIQKWYNIGKKDFVLRRKFRHEWKNDNTNYLTFEKLWLRVKRITDIPSSDIASRNKREIKWKK